MPSERSDGRELSSFDLERDLQRSDVIVSKVRDWYYAQALYAALCNN